MDGAATARGVRAGGGSPVCDPGPNQVYGERFSRQDKTLDIREAVIAPRSPWQNAYAERVTHGARRQLRLLRQRVSHVQGEAPSPDFAGFARLTRSSKRGRFWRRSCPVRTAGS